MSLSNVCIHSKTRSFLREQQIVSRRATLLSPPVSGFNIAADCCQLNKTSTLCENIPQVFLQAFFLLSYFCMCGRRVAWLLGWGVYNAAMSVCLYAIMNLFMYMRCARSTVGMCLCPSVCVCERVVLSIQTRRQKPFSGELVQFSMKMRFGGLCVPVLLFPCVCVSLTVCVHIQVICVCVCVVFDVSWWLLLFAVLGNHKTQ